MILYSDFTLVVFCVFLTHVETSELNDSTSNNLCKEPAVLLAHNSGVISIELTNYTQRNLTTGIPATGVDYHYQKNLLFWSYNKDNNSKIYVQSLCPLNENVNYTIQLNGLWQPVALAVDWLGDKLYVADVAGRKVDVFDLSGRNHAVLMSANLSSPADIALDPTSGIMFVGDNDQVVRANMDGTQMKTIISESTNTNNPFAVTVDTHTKRLYFSSSLLQYIESSDYDGNHRTPILKNTQIFFAPVSIDILQDKVFWSDNFNRQVKVIEDSATEDNIKSVNNTQEIYGPQALAILDPQKQPEATNPCGDNNGGCSHLCLITNMNESLSKRCACPHGQTLNSDLKSCRAIDEFLLFSQHTAIQGKTLNPAVENFNDAIFFDVSFDTRFIGVDFDAREEFIYYSEIIDNKIYRIYTNGTGNEVMVTVRGTLGDLQTEGIALDWVSKNLYYVQSRAGTLNVLLTTNKAYKKTLLKGLNRPRSVVVHPERGYIFLTEWGKPAKISRANTDGSNLFVFQAEVGFPNGLAVDYDEDRLYWCDGLLEVIQHANLQGEDIKTIKSNLIVHPFSIEIYKNHAYITDWKTYGLIRIDKRTGGDGRVIFTEHPYKRLYGVKVYSKERQRCQNPCIDSGLCQKFCYAIPGVNSSKLSAKCGCSDGEAVAPDGSSCVIETSLGPCPKTAFTCTNERCVPLSWKCDGVDDCGDNSDEYQCTYQ